MNTKHSSSPFSPFFLTLTGPVPLSCLSSEAAVPSSASSSPPVIRRKGGVVGVGVSAENEKEIEKRAQTNFITKRNNRRKKAEKVSNE